MPEVNQLILEYVVWIRRTRPAHRDLAGFKFEEAHVEERLIRELHQMKFLASTHNVVLVGGPGIGRTHVATSLGIEAIRAHDKRVRSSRRSNW